MAIKKFTDYIESGRTFHICRVTESGVADGWWAFEDNLLDADGRLSRPVNGLEGMHSESYKDVISAVHFRVRYEDILAEIDDPIEAARRLLAEEQG